MFKKLLFIALAIIGFVSCGSKNNQLIVGVSPIPHSELVNLVKDDLKKEGIDLKVVVFNDYVQPNLSLKDGSIDCNFFQHVPYMNNFNKKYNMDMVSVGKIHVEPIKIYSDKLKNINDFKANDIILIPNDPSNRGRALLLLDNAGIITLKDKTKLDSDLSDIISNPKKIKIQTINTEQIPPRLSEVAAGIINTNIALAAKVDQNKAIYSEGAESPYVNVVSVLKKNENNEKVKKLVKALQSQKVKDYINQKYKGQVKAVF